MNNKNAWDEVYKENDREELGWYEHTPEPSLSLIKKYLKNKKSIVLDAGCGEGTLIQSLLDNGFEKIIGMDFSSQAIGFLKENLKQTEGKEVELRVEDLSQNISFHEQGELWHDRAVFHFFQEDSLRGKYKENLNRFLKPQGIFVIACFSKENEAEKCNGLPVHKYTVKELQEYFKDSFKLKESLIYTYTMPFGDIRNYIYCIFSKI